MRGWRLSGCKNRWRRRAARCGKWRLPARIRCRRACRSRCARFAASSTTGRAAGRNHAAVSRIAFDGRGLRGGCGGGEGVAYPDDSYIWRNHAAAGAAGIRALSAVAAVCGDVWRRRSQCGGGARDVRIAGALCDAAASEPSDRRCGGGRAAALRRGHFADRAGARADAGVLRRDGREPTAFESGLRPRLQLGRAGQAGRYQLGRGVRGRGLVPHHRHHAGHQRLGGGPGARGGARGAGQGLTVSCDLNYRKNLWKWGKPAERGDAGTDAACGCGHRQRRRLPDGAGHPGGGGRAFGQAGPGAVSRPDGEGAGGVSQSTDDRHHAAGIAQRFAQRLVGVPGRPGRSFW